MWCETGERGVDELLGRCHAQDACRAAGGVDRGGVARQRTRVRRRCTGASRASACREQHDLLAGGERCLPGACKGTPVAEVFAIHHDHAGCLVGGERFDELGRFDVGLIAERREPRDAQAVLPCEQSQLDRQIAALRDDPHRARLELARAEVELGRRIEHAQAVRAEHHGSRRPHASHNGLLACLAVAVDLAEPCRDHHDRACAHRERPIDRILERSGRQSHDDELRRRRKLLERAVRPPSQDLTAVAVDEPDPPPV